MGKQIFLHLRMRTKGMQTVFEAEKTCHATLKISEKKIIAQSAEVMVKKDEAGTFYEK